jgi:hypothetical protein
MFFSPPELEFASMVGSICPERSSPVAGINAVDVNLLLIIAYRLVEKASTSARDSQKLTPLNLSKGVTFKNFLQLNCPAQTTKNNKLIICFFIFIFF